MASRINPRLFAYNRDQVKYLRDARIREFDANELSRSTQLKAQSIWLDLLTAGGWNTGDKRNYQLALNATNDLFENNRSYHLQSDAVRHIIRLVSSLLYQPDEPRLTLKANIKLVQGFIENINTSDRTSNILQVDVGGKSEDKIHNYFIGSRLLKLKLSSAPIYNFLGMYGCFFANEPFLVEGTDAGIILNKPSSSPYLIMERLPDSITFESYIDAMADAGSDFGPIREKLLQIFLALHRANMEYRFTHYDLTLKKITLYRPNGDVPLDIHYAYKSATGEERHFWVPTSDGYLAVISGFEESYMFVPNHAQTLEEYVTTRLPPDSLTRLYSPHSNDGNKPPGEYPLYDVFSLVVSVYDETWQRNADYIDPLIELLAPFNITTRNIDEILSRVIDYNYGLTWQDTQAETTKISITTYLNSVDAERWIKTAPTLPVMSCTTSTVAATCIKPGQLNTTLEPQLLGTINNFYDFHNLLALLEVVPQGIRIDYTRCMSVFRVELDGYWPTVLQIQRDDVVSDINKLTEYWIIITNALDSFASFDYVHRSARTIALLASQRDELIRNRQWGGERKQILLRSWAILQSWIARYLSSGDLRSRERDFAQIVYANR